MVVKRVVGGAIGNCAHIAGVYGFLNFAKRHGCEVEFLGPGVDPIQFANKVNTLRPDLVCISYRLNPDNLKPLLSTFFNNLDKEVASDCDFNFGGIPSCVQKAKEFGIFSRFFVGEEREELLLESLGIEGKVLSSNGGTIGTTSLRSPCDGRGRDALLKALEGSPLLRHHFGLGTLQETLEGIEKIAKSGSLDIISIAPDQNAQEFFFQPKLMSDDYEASGGVPIRTEDDLFSLKNAANVGRKPMLKIYSGTNDLLKWAEVSDRILEVPWGTVPVFWYSVLDGRSKRPLEHSISENLSAIGWYASRGIPVEINDSHQWSLRESSDAVAVASFYVSAYIAKKLGVKTYIGQFMFNTPCLTSGRMDIAKMMAKIEITKSLCDEDFLILRQARAGLTHFSIDPDISKGQLAASAILSSAIKPHIIHVVGFCEADHAASADEVIESCKIVRGAIKSVRNDLPTFKVDEGMRARTSRLVKEAMSIIDSHLDRCKDLNEDPLLDPHCLSLLVKNGLMDAPQLLPSVEMGCGRCLTAPFDGGYDSVDEDGNRIDEADRIGAQLTSKGDL